MRNKNKKGFTLVELVIVIAVIAILAAVLIPTFVTVIANANKSAALQEATNLRDQITFVYAEHEGFNAWCEDVFDAAKTEGDVTVSGDTVTIKTNVTLLFEGMEGYDKDNNETLPLSEIISNVKDGKIEVIRVATSGEKTKYTYSIVYKVDKYTVTVTASKKPDVKQA